MGVSVGSRVSSFGGECVCVGACVGGFLCVYMCARRRVRERGNELERQRKCVRVRCVCG